MRISAIKVYGLFNHFNHTIDFNPDERVVIMIGPNGYGKTMLLRIINALFNDQMQTLARLPFSELRLFFDDESALYVHRPGATPNPSEQRSEVPLDIHYVRNGEILNSFKPVTHVPQDDALYHLIDDIEDYIPDVMQVGARQWRRLGTRATLDLSEVLAQYGEYLPPEIRALESSLAGPDWFEGIKSSIPVRFIDTERLTRFSGYDETNVRYRRHYASRARSSPERTVRRYSDQLAEKVRSIVTEYANLSQSLDRSFPARLVEELTSPPPALQDLERRLKEVDRRRSEIIDSGLLRQDQETMSLPEIQEMDDSKLGVLAVYAQDAFDKLGVFDDLYERVKAFARIANARFLNKRVSVSRDGLKVFGSDGSDLNVEMLSSGEQHQLVLLYDLLFDTKPDSLVLIDEPELSLHVAWQREMLSDLQEMANLSQFSVLLATHSPQIIGDRLDLTVELSGANSA